MIRIWPFFQKGEENDIELALHFINWSISKKKKKKKKKKERNYDIKDKSLDPNTSKLLKKKCPLEKSN